MEMSGEYTIPAPRDKVWAALNDAAILQQCIPGAETVEQTADDAFAATVKAKVGPVSARFKGKVQLANIDPPNGYTISGEGSGGAAGFAKGSADVSLEDTADGGTRLSYTVKAQVGGKLAQIGQRFIDSTAAKMSEEFFSNFSQVAGQKEPEAGAAESTGDELPEIVDEAAHGIEGKSPDHDAISPTGSPLLPDEEAGFSISPWVWGPLIIVAVVVVALIIGL